MREIKSHVVNPANDKLKITARDEPGSGGANHEYEIALPDGSGVRIGFQNGPISEKGVNGITQEALLAIVEDRLTGFQRGPFACIDNADALSHIRVAMQILQNRTRERMSRGVEGKSVV